MNWIPDVIVVGGGVIGWSVAYQLTRRKARVLVLDRSLPGRATSASAGGLWPVGEAVGLGCGVIYHADHSDGPDPLPTPFRDFLVRSNACFPELAKDLRMKAASTSSTLPGPACCSLSNTRNNGLSWTRCGSRCRGGRRWKC